MTTSSSATRKRSTGRWWSACAGRSSKSRPLQTDYINPMDLNLNYSDDENPLSLKSDFILSPLRADRGRQGRPQPVEKTIIDRCVRMVYRDYLATPVPENMPILEDLYNELRRQEEKEAQYIATALKSTFPALSTCSTTAPTSTLKTACVSFDIKGAGQAAEEDRDADRAGRRVEPSHHQPGSPQIHPLLHRRNAPFAAARSRPPRTPWKSGSASASGAAFPPASPRTSKTCSPPARWRTSLKTPTMCLC